MVAVGSLTVSLIWNRYADGTELSARGWAAFERDDYELAEDLFTRALGRFTVDNRLDKVACLEGLAQVRFMMGQDTLAVQTIQQAKDLVRTDEAEFYVCGGWEAFFFWELTECRTQFETALQFDPCNLTALQMLNEFYLGAFGEEFYNPDSALVLARLAYEFDGSSTSMYDLYEVFIELEQPDSAIWYLERLYDLHELDAYDTYSLGLLFCKVGDTARGLPYIEEAASLGNNLYDHYFDYFLVPSDTALMEL
jgi:tetratricopeptide (TPR) repeat protein